MQTETKTAAKPIAEAMPAAGAIEVRKADISDLEVLDTALVLDDPRADAAVLEQKFARRQALMRICFRMTSPSQWQVFKDAKTGKASVYPTGGAADSIIRSILGCTWQDKEITIVRDGEGAAVSASATGWLCNRDGIRIEKFTGYREMGGFVKTEPDLRRCVLENLKSVAVRDVLGLRGRQPEELASLGLDLSKVGVATFENHKAGSESVVSIPFGKLKGVAINDPQVSEKELLYFIGKAQDSIADPSKSKYRASEEKRLAAYKAEIERRKTPPTTTPKSTPAPEDDYAPDMFPREPGDDGR